MTDADWLLGRAAVVERLDGSEVPGLVSDSLRDGLLAKGGLGRGAGVAGHTRKSPRTIDKSSPSHVPNSTTSAAGEVVA